ncbi:Uncharacterised protein [Vibrio cholerae]|nr:Uncharacterised protein [Vibrio cholerae]
MAACYTPICCAKAKGSYCLAQVLSLRSPYLPKLCRC